MKKLKGTKLEELMSKKMLDATSTEDLYALLKELETREGGTLKNLRTLRKNIESTLKRRAPSASFKDALFPPQEEGESNLPDVPEGDPQFMAVGDINLLINPITPTTAPFDQIIIEIAKRLIEKTGGLPPQMETRSIREGQDKAERIVIKWRLQRPLGIEELLGIHHACEEAYNKKISGRKTRGGWERIVKYIDTEGKTIKGKRSIYLGPMNYFSLTSVGVIVTRQFKSAAEAEYTIQEYPDHWFSCSVDESDFNIEIEIRDGHYSDDNPGLSQENLLLLIVQTAFILAHKKLINKKKLLTTIFKELNLVGTTHIERERLFGMQGVLGVIEKVLLLPIQQPHHASTHHLKPESILLVGVPGVGKTFLAHYLMTGCYDALFIPIDSNRLHQDLSKPEASTTLIQIDKIRKETGLPVIILLEDIDMFLEDEEMVTKFLYLLEGVRGKGFFVLASSNQPHQIDERLLEPGRLSRIIHVPIPTKEERKGVLANHCTGIPFKKESERESIIKYLAEKTQGWTQRYLRYLCQEASRVCILEGVGGDIVQKSFPDSILPLQKHHFVNAFEELTKSIDTKHLAEADKEIQSFVTKHGNAIGFQ